MVKIRLKRLGYKKNPFYRIIVINSREKREGKAIAELGNFDPKKKILKLDKEQAQEWIKKGAQPSDRVKYLIENSDEQGNLILKEKPTKAEKKKAKEEVEEIKKAEEVKSVKEAEEVKKAEEVAEEVVEETVVETTEEASV
ncbi:MAG: 30S ribosomal protein S16 [Candidatus Gastranaerophilales bacterium]|nr:30S ribosomal protein S16 [Candidatus Gastranaerophilales bacterium]